MWEKVSGLPVPVQCQMCPRSTTALELSPPSTFALTPRVGISKVQGKDAGSTSGSGVGTLAGGCVVVVAGLTVVDVAGIVVVDKTGGVVVVVVVLLSGVFSLLSAGKSAPATSVF